METVTMIIAGLVALAVLVVIHEAGHMVVAKIFKVGVPVFSIGMGPRMAGFVWKGTDWRISWLPVGGYVRMSGADPFGEEDPDEIVTPDEDFMLKPVWQRLLIMLAGPFANLLLPIVLLTGVYMLGEPQEAPVVGSVSYASPAFESGMRPGDQVTAVNGEPVFVWADFIWQLSAYTEREVVIDLERDGNPLSVTIPAGSYENIAYGAPEMESIGVNWGRRPSRIGVDDPTSPAAQAGLRTGDGILAVDGEKVEDWYQLSAALKDGDVHALKYRRGRRGEPVTEGEITLKPDPSWTPREGDPLANQWGILPVDLFVGRVVEESAAEKSGVEPSDRLYAIDGQKIRDFEHLVALVRKTASGKAHDADVRPLQLTLIRAGNSLDLSFRPRMTREVQGPRVIYRPIMGITRYTGVRAAGPMVVRYYALTEAVPRATNESVRVFRTILTVLGSLVTGERKVQESIGGPIEIFAQAAAAAERGIFEYARLVGFISISLGVVNLLPVPVLDGGHIVFYAIEGIRGRPLSLAVREKVQMVGVLVLVAVMLVVFALDIQRNVFPSL